MRIFLQFTALSLALGFGAALDARAADQVVLYRCTNANGDVTVQDSECPKGSTGKKLTYDVPPPPKVETPPTPPAASDSKIAASPAKASTAEPAAAAAPGAVAVAPPLWTCRGLDNKPYLSEVADPPTKCLPLASMGYDVSRLPPDLAGSCQEVRDECRELQGPELCEAWRSRRDETKAELAKAFSDEDDAWAERLERFRAAAAACF